MNIIKNLYRDKRALKKAFTFGHESETIKYIIEGTYNPGFIITRVDGHQLSVEAKGYLDDQARRKMLAVRKCHPDKDIRFLFYSNNKMRRNAKLRYLDWAIKNGFNGAVVGDRVPVEWLLGGTFNDE